MNPEHLGIGMTSQRVRDRLVDQLRAMGIGNETVLEAIRSIPRHLFVDEALSSRAYQNTALPIGYGQTISQPYIVARMTEAVIGAKPLRRVLEIGAGCGYQSAVISRFAERVFSVERIAALADKTRSRLKSLGIDNVRVTHGDGNEGWSRHSPYDAVIVAAAPIGVPEKLYQQIGENGCLVIPVGSAGEQQLLKITRTDHGFEQQLLDRVSFVPMLKGLD